MLRVIEVNVLEKMIIHLECLHSKTSATYFVLGKKIQFWINQISYLTWYKDIRRQTYWQEQIMPVTIYSKHLYHNYLFLLQKMWWATFWAQGQIQKRLNHTNARVGALQSSSRVPLPLLTISGRPAEMSCRTGYTPCKTPVGGLVMVEVLLPAHSRQPRESSGGTVTSVKSVWSPLVCCWWWAPCWS